MFKCLNLIEIDNWTFRSIGIIYGFSNRNSFSDKFSDIINSEQDFIETFVDIFEDISEIHNSSDCLQINMALIFVQQRRIICHNVLICRNSRNCMVFRTEINNCSIIAPAILGIVIFGNNSFLGERLREILATTRSKGIAHVLSTTHMILSITWSVHMMFLHEF